MMELVNVTELQEVKYPEVWNCDYEEKAISFVGKTKKMHNSRRGQRGRFRALRGAPRYGAPRNHPFSDNHWTGRYCGLLELYENGMQSQILN